MGIQADEKGNRGQYACLVACSANAEPCEESIGLAMPGASVPPFFKFLLAEPLQVRDSPGLMCPCTDAETAQPRRVQCISLAALQTC